MRMYFSIGELKAAQERVVASACSNDVTVLSGVMDNSNCLLYTSDAADE